MKAVIIFNSLTGTTEKAAHRIASVLQALRVEATPVPIAEADEPTVADVDLVIVGTWTDGIVVMRQKPAGKRKLPGACPRWPARRRSSTAPTPSTRGTPWSELVAEVQARGADVIGGFALARHEPGDVAEFIDRLGPLLHSVAGAPSVQSRWNVPRRARR